MGLDMYLTKKVYIGAEYEYCHVTGTVDLKRNGKRIKINVKKISYIEESAGYWRKANMIHCWFVDHIQDGEDDCGTYFVDMKSLQLLLEVVESVLANHELAQALLPTSPGFFFGQTAYDKWYFEDLRETRKILKAALKSKNGEFYYHSSW